MAITAAQVEANGWVLRLTFSGTPGTFSSYTLDPDGAPRLVLASSHAGFVKSAGTAVAGTLARSLIGTKPLRLPVNPADPNTPVLDETDLGGGLVQVRIALSEHIYATESGLGLTVLAGWRDGEGAASGLAVVNSSTLDAPVPIMRWALLPERNAPAMFRLSLIVASQHPLGLEPVAGVKFTATDGATVKTVWATEQGTDDTYGDGLRCYTALIDPTTATALTAGILRCDAEVYPWLGAMRSTDPTGARSMVDVASFGTGGAGGQMNSTAQSPTVVVHDPAGTLFGERWLFVDPAGTAIASAAMVKVSLAEARALPQAERPANIKCVMQALYLANRTRAAANGQASQTRSAENANVVLAAGVHAFDGTTVTSGVSTGVAPMRILGDPQDANPRANCIIRSGTANPAGWQGINRLHFSNLTFEIGQVAAVLGVRCCSFENISIKGKPGFTTNNVAFHGSQPATGRWNFAAAGISFTQYGGDIGQSLNDRFSLVRAAIGSRAYGCITLLTSRWVSDSGLAADATNATAVRGFIATSDADGCSDTVVAYCDLRACRQRAWTPPQISSAASGETIAGVAVAAIRRQAFLHNIVERFGNSATPLFALGEGSHLMMRDNIIEGNTIAGERCNFFYNDPGSATLNSEAFRNRVAGNLFAAHANKHDSFFSGTYGYRPHLIGAWSSLYGVNWSGNADLRSNGVNAGDFRNEYYGRNSLQSTTALDGDGIWTADASFSGSNTGYGNYALLAGTVAEGRILTGNGDRDWSGAPRSIGGSAGAFQLGGGPAAASLAPAGSLHGQAATASLLGLVLALVPDGAAVMLFTTAAQLQLQGTLAPASATSTLSGAGPDVSGSETLLLPGDLINPFGNTPVLVFPSGGTVPVRTLRIGPDPRSLGA